MPFPAMFPTEVEKNIINQLDGDFASLRNCVLTCRAWVPRSRTLLLCAVRIGTRSTWYTLLDYFQANPDMQPLVQSVATAPIPTERMRLLGTYPHSLVKTLPNLRRWEIRAPVDAEDDQPPRIFFHRATLVQLRLSLITELHVSSLRFASQADFVRLLSAIPRLRVLECTEIQFTRAEGISTTTSNCLLRRTLPLETLQISQGNETDVDVLPLLLELTASSLQNLVLRRREASERFHDVNSSLVGHRPPLARAIAETTATLSESRSLLLHIYQALQESVSTLFLEVFEQAVNVMWVLHRRRKLETLEIHIRVSDILNNLNSQARTSSIHPESLALQVLLGHYHYIQNRYRALEAPLLADWDTHLTVLVHIPPFWARREVVIKREMPSR